MSHKLLSKTLNSYTSDGLEMSTLTSFKITIPTIQFNASTSSK